MLLFLFTAFLVFGAGLSDGGGEMVLLCARAASDMNSRPDCSVALLSVICIKRDGVRKEEWERKRWEKGREE